VAEITALSGSSPRQQLQENDPTQKRAKESSELGKNQINKVDVHSRDYQRGTEC